MNSTFVLKDSIGKDSSNKDKHSKEGVVALMTLTFDNTKLVLQIHCMNSYSRKCARLRRLTIRS